jgi:hypothetical protein
MAHKGEVKTTKTFEQIIYPHDSRMNNYELYYDESIQQMRCGYYTNKNKDQNFDQDTIYIVEPGYEHRLDLISLKFYETVKLDWYIADANNIKDPIQDIVAGKKLVIPDPSKRK